MSGPPCDHELPGQSKAHAVRFLNDNHAGKHHIAHVHQVSDANIEWDAVEMSWAYYNYNSWERGRV